MTETGQELGRQTHGPSPNDRQEGEPSDPMNVAQDIQAMRQEQTNILNIQQDLCDSIEGPEEENEEQQIGHAANEGRQPNHTTTAANTQQDPAHQHRQSEIDTYRQYLNTTALEHQQYYAPSAFVTLVKPIPVQAFATHPLYPIAESYQQLLTLVTPLNSALVLGLSSCQNQYAKNPAMASTSILHHA